MGQTWPGRSAWKAAGCIAMLAVASCCISAMGSAAARRSPCIAAALGQHASDGDADKV